MEVQNKYAITTRNGDYDDEPRSLSVIPQQGMMSGATALAQMSEQEFTAKLSMLKTGRNRIAIIQRELMEPDVDYGVIPGTNKPTLLKPGAEKLCQFYGFVADFQSERLTCNDETGPQVSYITRCYIHLGDISGPVVAVGLGSANSWERKYRYRLAEKACPECGALSTIIKGKAEYGGGYICFARKGGCGAKFAENDERITKQQLGQVENPDPYDLDNTLLKMSEKRSHIDGTMKATATSGLFANGDVKEEEQTTGPGPKPAAVAERMYKEYCDTYKDASEMGLTLIEHTLTKNMTAKDVQAKGRDLKDRILEYTSKKAVISEGESASNLLYGKEETRPALEQLRDDYQVDVKAAMELGLNYIPLAELTDEVSLKAAGKALAAQIREARENQPVPEQPGML